MVRGWLTVPVGCGAASSRNGGLHSSSRSLVRSVTRRAFCTYFDVNYLPRGLALFESLRLTALDFTLDVLALDDDAADELERRNLPGLRITRLGELEAADSELVAVRDTRSRVEYIFTTGPAFMRHLFDRDPTIELLTYLDSDLYFFASPEVLFQEAIEADAATVIVGHRFPPRLRDQEIYGKYNVAWVSFRRDVDGLACLDYWRTACIAWCYDRPEDGRFADQKYLDDFPERFRRVHELTLAGADVAPWNISSPPLRHIDGRFLVGDEPVIFFHFQGLRRPWPWLVDLHLEPYGEKATVAVRRIYELYLKRLAEQAGGATIRSARGPRKGVVKSLVSSARGLRRRTSVLYVGGRLL